MNYGPLYYADLVKRSHPLNRGRVAWWLAVPWYMSGPRFIDICGRNHGTLTNGPTWSGKRRPGGYGSLNCDGTDDEITGPTSGPLNFGSTSFTAGGWVNGVPNTAVVCGKRANASGIEAGWSIKLSGGGVKVYFGDGTAGTEPTIGTTSGLGDWHRVLVTFNRTTTTITAYVDAVQTGTASIATVTGSVDNAIAFKAARISERLTGQIDDVTGWNRALSASEVAADYDLSRRGYPGVLNRVRQFAYAAPPALPDIFDNAKLYTFPPQASDFVFPAQENEFTFPPQPSDLVFPPEP